MEKKNVPRLEKYISAFADKKHHGGASIFSRELLPDFLEAEASFQIITPHNDNPAIGDVDQYYVTMLFYKNVIISYELSVQNGHKTKTGWKQRFDIYRQYRNDSMYNLLLTGFKKYYGAILNEKELFSDDIVYGSHCGNHGKDPEYRIKLEILVANKNIKELKNWLRSTIVEKQVYGVEGFYVLAKNGVKINDEEKLLIKKIKHKKGYLNTCSGCIHVTLDISEVLKEFDFTQFK